MVCAAASAPPPLLAGAAGFTYWSEWSPYEHVRVTNTAVLG